MFCSQVLCAVGYVFVDNLVFETKGLALQDIEGVMLTKEAQWSGRELASSEEDGDASVSYTHLTLPTIYSV